MPPDTDPPSSSGAPGTFALVERVAALFASFPGPWFVAGGWAIDLFVGAVTRPHDDLEVSILRDDQERLHAHLAGWELDRIAERDGKPTWVPWPADERLELPDFQVRARRPDALTATFEAFLTDAPGGVWRFRRDPRITRPLAEVAARSSYRGVPCIAPEIMLLHKSTYHRPQDEHDFRQVVPRFTAAQSAWLRAALRTYRPDDPWLAALP
jgi:hypothetical protein